MIKQIILISKSLLKIGLKIIIYNINFLVDGNMTGES